MPERDLCNAIVEFLNYQGAWVWRTNSGMVRAEYQGKTRMIRMNRAGTSDILGLYKGHFVAFEVKLPKTRKNVTQAQNEFIERIRQHGGIAAVVTSPEEALAELQTRAKELARKA